MQISACEVNRHAAGAGRLYLFHRHLSLSAGHRPFPHPAQAAHPAGKSLRQGPFRQLPAHRPGQLLAHLCPAQGPLAGGRHHLGRPGYGRDLRPHRRLPEQPGQRLALCGPAHPLVPRTVAAAGTAAGFVGGTARPAAEHPDAAGTAWQAPGGRSAPPAGPAPGLPAVHPLEISFPLPPRQRAACCWHL